MSARAALLVAFGLLLLPLSAQAAGEASGRSDQLPYTNWRVLVSWFWVGRLLALVVSLACAFLTLPPFSISFRHSAVNRWMGGWLWALGTCGVALAVSVPQLLPGGSVAEMLFGGGIGTCAAVLVPFVWFAGACIAGAVQVSTGYDWRALVQQPGLLDARRDGGFFWGIESGLIALALALVTTAVATLSISEWVIDKWFVVCPAVVCVAVLCAIGTWAFVCWEGRDPTPQAASEPISWGDLLRLVAPQPPFDAGGADSSERERSEGPNPMCPRCLARAQFDGSRCENCGYGSVLPAPSAPAPTPPPAEPGAAADPAG